VGLIPNEVVGFFDLSNPTSCTVVLGSTKPVTDMSTRNLPVGKGWLVRKAENLTTIFEGIV
jgi:hypothetical protein